MYVTCQEEVIDEQGGVGGGKGGRGGEKGGRGRGGIEKVRFTYQKHSHQEQLYSHLFIY